MEEIKKILNGADNLQKRALFSFTSTDTEKAVLFKFGLWIRYFFPKYIKSDDAPFHKDIDSANYKVYRGLKKSFVDIAFRGAAKTARTKLFMAFCITNDVDHFRKYIKIIAEDGTNSKQIATDIYNMLINDNVKAIYPDIFAKTKTKREETMGSFTTSTGVKVVGDIVGTDQRGAIQEDSRPDLIWFEDFENRKTLRSAVKTISIWDNMEEARTGLSKEGGAIYTCNYISEQGNVHKLVKSKSDSRIVLIIPIIDKDGNPAWSRYSKADIAQMRSEDDDFEGERLCVKPDTPILTKEGWKEISLLKVGDMVATHLNRYKKILRIMKSNATDLLDITVNGKVVTITKNHPVLIMRNKCLTWLPAGELKKNDLTLSVLHDKLGA